MDETSVQVLTEYLHRGRIDSGEFVNDPACQKFSCLQVGCVVYRLDLLQHFVLLVLRQPHSYVPKLMRYALLPIRFRKTFGDGIVDSLIAVSYHQ